MTDIFKKVFMTGIGAVALTVEKAGEIIDELVRKGEITFEQGKEMAKEYKDKFSEYKDKFSEYKAEFDVKMESKVKETMRSMNLVTKDEMQALLKRVDALEKAANKEDAE